MTTKSYPRWKKHGMTGTPEHRSWTQMKGRCLNPNNKRWHRYGGRGITVAIAWIRSFEAFYRDMGPRPKGTSLERVNNDGNYEPSNCVWATPTEQQNNMRRNVFIKYCGQRKTVAQWGRETGIPEGTLRARIRRGWTVEEVFNPNIEQTRKRVLPGKRYSPCEVKDCERDSRGRGTLCKRHVQAQRRGSVLTAGPLYGAAKLKPSDIPLLRAAIQTGERTILTARKFGVSKATIRDIARGETWKGISR